MTYTIQPGDSLSKISQKFFGDYSMANTLAQVNKIANANLIYPGQTITIPDVSDAVVVQENTNANTTSTASNNTGKNIRKGVALLLLGVAGYFGYRYIKSNTDWFDKKKSALNGVKKKLSFEKVKIGDHLLLKTDDELAKVKVTSVKDEHGRREINGQIFYKGKSNRKVLILKSDFDKGNVIKISRNKKVRQVIHL